MFACVCEMVFVFVCVREREIMKNSCSRWKELEDKDCDRHLYRTWWDKTFEWADYWECV